MTEGLSPTVEVDAYDPQEVYAQLTESRKREKTALNQKPPDYDAAKAEGQYRDRLLKEYEKIALEPLGETRKERRAWKELLADHNLLQMNESVLAEMEADLKRVEGLDDSKKKRWLNLIGRARECQRKARSDIVPMWCYCGRNQETGARLRLARMHVRILRELASDAPGVLIMAPLRHGKSQMAQALPLWVWAKQPELRIAIVRATEDDANGNVGVLRRYLTLSKEYRALFPHVRILSRAALAAMTAADGNQPTALDNSKQFTLRRPNWSSSQASCEAVAAESNPNGAGFDLLLLDDPCTPRVASQQGTRDAINRNFFEVILRRVGDPETSKIRGIGSPWDKDDVYGKITKQVENGALKGWKVIRDEFAIKEDADTGLPIPVWPERWNAQRLQEIRDTLPSDAWARLYELRIETPSDTPVKQLHYYTMHAGNLNHDVVQMLPADKRDLWERQKQAIETMGERFLSIDPSATKGASSTKTAIAEISLMSTGTAYILAGHELPGDPTLLREWILQRICGPELYAARRVIIPYADRLGDSMEVRDAKRRLAHTLVEAMGRIDVVLFERSGGIVGQVKLTEDDILKDLWDMGVQWHGSFAYERTQGLGGGNQIGKVARLRQVSPAFHGRKLLFPGTWVKQQNPAASVDRTAPPFRWATVCCNDPQIQEMKRQVLSPTHMMDYADAISQFLRHCWTRLMPESVTVELPKAEVTGYADGLTSALRGRLARLREPTGISTINDGEEQWLLARWNAA